MKASKIIFIVLAILLTLAGCILSSGTFVVTYHIDAVQPTLGHMVPIHVDLTQISDYQKHKDKIESVDAISLVGEIANRYGNDAGTQIWVSDGNYDNEDSVRANGSLIFETPVIAVGDTLKLDYTSGMDFIRNIDVLKWHVKSDGNFYLYGIATAPSIILYHITAVVTITAGL